MKYKLRRQSPVKGGRGKAAGAVLHEIERAVENEASKYRVSKSFVVAVRLAKSYGIKIESYMDWGS